MCQLRGIGIILPIFTEEGLKTQKSYVTCTGSHSLSQQSFHLRRVSNSRALVLPLYHVSSFLPAAQRQGWRLMWCWVTVGKMFNGCLVEKSFKIWGLWRGGNKRGSGANNIGYHLETPFFTEHSKHSIDRTGLGLTKDSDLDWERTKVGKRIANDLGSSGACSLTLISLERLV